MNRTEPGRAKPKAWVRVVAFFATVFTAWHIFASFLWIAPYSENAREVVPPETLSSYMLPFFGQSWSVFAPEPINGDYHLNVRAMVEDESGALTETGWVSATDVELSMIKYNLTPPRAGIQSSEVASNYKSAFDKMQDVQRAIVGGDFIVDEWEVGLSAALERQAETGEDQDSSDGTEAEGTAEEGASEVDPAEDAPPEEPATPVNTAEIEQMLAEEHRTTAYATQVAKAIWGDGVQQVQYRVSRQNIVPFAQRHDPGAQRPDPTIVLPGWRGLIVEEGQNEENFADVFGGQFERITR